MTGRDVHALNSVDVLSDAPETRVIRTTSIRSRPARRSPESMVTSALIPEASTSRYRRRPEDDRSDGWKDHCPAASDSS